MDQDWGLIKADMRGSGLALFNELVDEEEKKFDELVGFKEKYDKLLLKETETHNENVSLKTKVDVLKDEVISLVKKIEQSHEILKEANSDILGDIKKGLTKEQLKEQIKELEHQNYCLRQNAKGYGAEEVDEYRKEIEELKDEAVQNKELFDKTFGELMKVKKEHERSCKIFKEHQEMMSKEKFENEEKIDKLEKDKEELLKGWEGLRGQFGDLKEENKMLKEVKKTNLDWEKDIVRIKQAITCDDPNDWSIDDVVEWLEQADKDEWSVVEEIKKLLGKTDPEEIIEEIKSLMSDAHRWEGRMNKLSEVIERSLPKMDGWVTEDWHDEIYGELKKEFDKQSQTIQLAKEQRDNIVDYLVNCEENRIERSSVFDLLDISDDEVKKAEQRTIEKAQVFVDRGLKL